MPSSSAPKPVSAATTPSPIKASDWVNTFFNSAEVGTPVALYVFQHARIAALTERLSLDYEWNFGLSFG